MPPMARRAWVCACSGRHARGEVGCDLLFDMVAQLVVDFLVDLLAAKQRERSGGEG